MKKAIALSLLFFTLACNPALMNKGRGGEVKSTSHNYLTSLEYKSRAVLLTELKDKAERYMWDKQTIKAEYDVTPYGSLIFRWARATIGAADAAWFTAVVKQDSLEILRQRGPSTVPRSSDIGWNDLMIVDLPEIDGPFDVYLIDDIQKKRFSWRVTPE